MTIAHRRCVEFYSRRRIDVLDNELQTDLIDESTLVSQNRNWVINNKKLRWSKRLELPLAQRMVVELGFFNILRHAITTQLQESENTIKSRLYSGVEKLKRELEVMANYNRITNYSSSNG